MDNGQDPALHAFVSPLIRIDAEDADELAEKVRDWRVELTQLHPGAFTGSAVLIPLKPLLVCRAMFSRPLLQKVIAPPGCVTITRKGSDSAPLVYCGRAFEPGECAVFGPGAEAEGVSRGVQFATTVSIPLGVWQAEAHWLCETDLCRAQGVCLRNAGESWIAGYLRRVEWILDAVAQVPAASERPGVCESMADSLLAYVNTLGTNRVEIRDDRDMRTHRRLAVERARAYINQNLTESIRLADLCRHARTQARSLEYGFQEMLGMSPIAYVRLIRLHRARRLLRSKAVRTRSISEIALDCGFWHLSQFAVDYKMLFGERPSVTLRRTLERLPRSVRRRETTWSLAPVCPLVTPA